MFGNTPIFGWFIMLLIFAAWGIPVYFLAKRAGFSSTFCGVMAILAPFLNVILIWVLAFIEWPNLPKNSAAEESA